ncbi:hypothetical protein ACVMB1_000313 [Bradyrhizobium sp. USDA 4504]
MQLSRGMAQLYRLCIGAFLFLFGVTSFMAVDCDHVVEQNHAEQLCSLIINELLGSGLR